MAHKFHLHMIVNMCHSDAWIWYIAAQCRTADCTVHVMILQNRHLMECTDMCPLICFECSASLVADGGEKVM